MPRTQSIFALALGSVAPPHCLCCRVALIRPAIGPALCARCAAAIERERGHHLRADAINAGFAPLSYSGVGRNLVAALKFSRLLVAAELGATLIASRSPPRLLDGVIVPVPSSPLRSLRRGFDPASELAVALAGATGAEISPALRRRDLRRQRGHSRRDRMARPPLIAMAGPAPPRALLVDDVVTTGATLTSCARALREAGSGRVDAVAIAAVSPGRKWAWSQTLEGVE